MTSTTNNNFSNFSDLLLAKYNIYHDISYIIYNYAASIIDHIIRIEKYLSLYSSVQNINFSEDIGSIINNDEEYELNPELKLTTLFNKKSIIIPNIILKHHRDLIEDVESYMEMKVDEIINLFHPFIDPDTVFESYSIYKNFTSNDFIKVNGKVSFVKNALLIKYDNLYYSIKGIHVCSYQVDATVTDMKYIVIKIELDLYDEIISKNIYTSYMFAVLH